MSADPKKVPDPFNLEALRLDASFLEAQTGVKKLHTTVPVRRPSDQDWFRAHPDPAYRMDFAMISLKEDREDYLVAPALVTDLANEVTYKTLFTVITRQGTILLWPVRLAMATDRRSDWWRSAREAAETAVGRWVRVKPNMQLGAYEIFEAQAVIPEPKWPELSFQELVRIAFRDRLIDRLDHPVIARLRGLS